MEIRCPPGAGHRSVLSARSPRSMMQAGRGPEAAAARTRALQGGARERTKGRRVLCTTAAVQDAWLRAASGAWGASWRSRGVALTSGAAVLLVPGRKRRKPWRPQASTLVPRDVPRMGRDGSRSGEPKQDDRAAAVAWDACWPRRGATGTRGAKSKRRGARSRRRRSRRISATGRGR
jgi:hypothetical protein